jgi:hypothetical protein
VSPVLDLRREVRSAPPLILAGLDGLAAEDRAAALANWRDRMVSEHASARVFAQLLPQLMRAGVWRRHLAAVAAMVTQELDHAVLCARVVTALGGEAAAQLPDALPDVPSHADAEPIEAALRNVLSISCCSETVAVALVAAEREHAGNDALRALLEQILADEVKHARFGWKLLNELGPALGAQTKARLGAYLVVAFEHQIAFHAPFLNMGRASDRGLAIGAPDGPGNWSTFVDTMERVVVPGLDAHGLRAGAAWRSACENMVKRAA